MRLSALTLVIALATLSARSGSAQWYLGLELASAHYGGSSRDTSGDLHAGPGTSTALGLRIEHSIRRIHAALRLSYDKPGFGLGGQGVTFTDKTTGQHIEATALLSFRVGGIGPSGAVRAELGPALHLWKFGDEIRPRLGGIGAVGYEWPVTGRFSGRVRLEGMLSRSWFDAADVPPEFERRVTWRYGVGIGLRYRLT